MPYDPRKHHRRSIRLPEYDYSQPGAYFVTICAYQMAPLFGEIIAGEMRLNAAGRIVREEWQRLARQFPNISLDAFVVMPNHLHGIIIIHPPAERATRLSPNESSSSNDPHSTDTPAGLAGSPRPVRATRSSPNESPSSNDPEPIDTPADLAGSPQRSPQRPKGPPKGSLGAMIGQFKSRATRRIWRLPEYNRLPIWQRNYYERIIRNQTAFERIRAYIRTNPRRWTAG